MRILYLTNYRFPTERAHGWQVAKMCEALAAGAHVELWHPRRRQPEAELEQDLRDYYGIGGDVAVRSLGNVDVFRIQRFLPAPVFELLYSVHAIVWGLFAAFKAGRTPSDLYYTRDPVLAFWLTSLRRPTFFECHVIRRRLGRFFLRRLTRARFLVGSAALTQAMRRELVELGFEPGKTIVLPDAVDPRPFRDAPDRDGCRLRNGLPLGEPIVGYVGSFSAMGMQKGIVELIEAVGELRVRQPIIVCVGGPLEGADLYRRAAERAGLDESRLVLRDRVPRSEVAGWIKSCDVVTIPWPFNTFSDVYTSPLKMFEYMAAGVPIVASDLQSLRDILRDGENALLVTPGDHRALAGAIEKILGDDELGTRLARAASADVAQHTWDKRAQRVLDHVGAAIAAPSSSN